jgi:hypothetical protein
MFVTLFLISALLDLTMKRFLETLILRSEFSEIIAPFSNASSSFPVFYAFFASFLNESNPLVGFLVHQVHCRKDKWDSVQANNHCS